jgi:hypothetical protein
MFYFFQYIGVPAFVFCSITWCTSTLTISFVYYADMFVIIWKTSYEFIPGSYWGSCYSIFSFICMFCRSLFVLLYFFLLAIVLSVLLRFTDSEYPFGIFKLFLWLCPALNGSDNIINNSVLNIFLFCFFF